MASASVEIQKQVRLLEKQIREHARQIKAQRVAGKVLLDYLKMMGDGKTANTAQMRKIRGAAAEFI